MSCRQHAVTSESFMVLHEQNFRYVLYKVYMPNCSVPCVEQIGNGIVLSEC